MTVSKCESCIETKTAPNTHTRCTKCSHYRPLKPAELAKAAKRAPRVYGEPGIAGFGTAELHERMGVAK